MSDSSRAGQLLEGRQTRRPCPPWCALPHGHAWELETEPPEPRQALRFHEAPLVLDAHAEIYLVNQETAALTPDGTDVYGPSQTTEPRLAIYLPEAHVDAETAGRIAASITAATRYLDLKEGGK